VICSAPSHWVLRGFGVAGAVGAELPWQILTLSCELEMSGPKQEGRAGTSMPTDLDSLGPVWLG
jgi:hypothetical protein